MVIKLHFWCKCSHRSNFKCSTTSITGFSSTVNGSSFTSGYSSSELDAGSGDVMYIENRALLQEATDQTENVKLIIEF